MPGVPEQRRRQRGRTTPRRSAELSPELNEVLKMLKTLEDRPETVVARVDDSTG